MGGARHSTTAATTEWPSWLQPYAQGLGQSAYNLLLPGGQVQQMPANLNQQVAGFTPFQQQGIGDIAGATGAQQQEVGQLGQSVSDTLSGKYLDPSTNPWLQATYGQAARDVTNQYQTATAPSLMAQAQQAGAFGGSAFDQQQALNQYGLGQNLQNLATNIYGQNYQQERGRQMGEQQMVPQLMQAETMPGQSLLGVGGLQQAQQQQTLDTAFQNAMRQFQFPQQNLQELGTLLGMAQGPAGQSTTVTPNRAGWLK